MKQRISDNLMFVKVIDDRCFKGGKSVFVAGGLWASEDGARCFSLPSLRLFIINTRDGNHWSDPVFKRGWLWPIWGMNTPCLCSSLSGPVCGPLLFLEGQSILGQLVLLKMFSLSWSWVLGCFLFDFEVSDLMFEVLLRVFLFSPNFVDCLICSTSCLPTKTVLFL